MMKSRNPIAALVVSLLAAAPAAAQTEAADTLPRYTLEGVTVITTRGSVDRSRIPRRIDLVTDSDMARAGARSVAEGLRSNVAIDVIEYPGLLTGVSIRGFRPQFTGITPRTLILVDGRPAGTNNLSLFSPGSVERVEVLRGPASALYGPSAMGGVVNLVRKRSSGPIAGAVELGYGSFGQYEGRLSAGGDLGDRIDFDLSVTSVGQSAGYRTGSRPAADSLLKTLPDGATVRLPWTSADTVLRFSEYGSRNIDGRLGAALNEAWRVDLSLEDQRADDVQNPGDLNVTGWDGRSIKDVVRRSYDLLLSGEVGRFTPSARAYTTTERIDYYNAADPPNFVNFRTPIRSYGGQVQSTWNGSPAVIVGGVEYGVAESYSERFFGPGEPGAPFSPDARIASAAAFAEARLDLLDGRLGATAGLRFDRINFEILETPHLVGFPANEESNDVVSPSAGLRFRPVPGVQLYSSIGRAFVTPDAFQVAGYSEFRAGPASQSVFVTRGNPDLESENSINIDGGVTLSLPRKAFIADVAYFHTNVRDRIASSLLPGGGQVTAGGDTILSIATPINVDEGRIRGIEARVEADAGQLLGAPLSLRVFLNGTAILEAEERFTATGERRKIRNVADRTLVAGIESDPLRLLSARLTARYVGERVDTDYVAWWEPGEIRYPSYTRVDLHLAARIAGRYRVRVDVQNLTDADYFEVRGYNLPGRNLRVGLGAALR